MTLIQAILIGAATAGMILFNVVLMQVNRLLAERGFSTSLYDDFRIFGSLTQVISDEEDPQRRSFLIQLRRKLKSSLVVSLSLFAAFCVTLFWWPVSLR